MILLESLGETMIETDHEDPMAAEIAGGIEASPARFIFISYRTVTDAPLAAALKLLIESSVDSTLNVFVSGDGGLVRATAS